MEGDEEGEGDGGPAIIFWKLGGRPVESVAGLATVASIGWRWRAATPPSERLDDALDEERDTDEMTEATSLAEEPERFFGFISRSMPDSTAAEGESLASMSSSSYPGRRQTLRRIERNLFWGRGLAAPPPKQIGRLPAGAGPDCRVFCCCCKS